MSHTIHSPKLEEYFKQYDLEKCISFMRTIFRFSYTKARSNDGVYIWFGDRDWDYKSLCPMANIEYCSFIFIDYTEDQVIHKFDKYQRLKAFL
jgi:hypothetical protein